MDDTIVIPGATKLIAAAVIIYAIAATKDVICALLAGRGGPGPQVISIKK